MMKFLGKNLSSAKREFLGNPFIYSLLFIILFLAFFIRIYRLDQLLGFYYDQGRDALVIWDFLKNKNFYLIGPTTGIEGIFRGPWYYWLITPFYFLGQGNPVLPAVFLAFTTVIAIFLLYKLGKILGGNETGILAAIIGSFSVLFMHGARWLSNPTPMFLISMLLVYFLYLVTTGKKWAWVLITFLLGMAMQFGSAGEVFYFPAVAIFAFSNKKYFPSRKILFLSLGAFFITVIPQLVFNLRNQGILGANIEKFLIEKESFKLSFWQMLKIRGAFYYDIFISKIFPANKPWGGALLLVLFTSLIVNLKNLWKIETFRIVFLLTFVPLLGMLFFQGNEGNVYDYYFTGYYFIYVLFASVLLTSFLKGRLGVILVSVFLLIFLSQNIPFVAGFLTSRTDGESGINLESQKKAIAWVYEDAGGKEFNVDVYVPPVLPYAYDYLFRWQGTEVYGYEPSVENKKLLYTLYEIDPPHPERLAAWLARQKGIGKVEKVTRFGGITVERRQRFGK